MSQKAHLLKDLHGLGFLFLPVDLDLAASVTWTMIITLETSIAAAKLASKQTAASHQETAALVRACPVPRQQVVIAHDAPIHHL